MDIPPPPNRTPKPPREEVRGGSKRSGTPKQEVTPASFMASLKKNVARRKSERKKSVSPTSSVSSLPQSEAVCLKPSRRKRKRKSLHL